MSAIARSAIPPCLLAFGLRTDAQVRPKASGYRHESTNKSAFVICGYDTPAYDSATKQALIYFTSMDGVSRNISCKAVSGMAGAESMVYSTKSISSTAAEAYTALLWTPSDFGGRPTFPAAKRFR